MEIRRLTIADYDEIVKLWAASDLPFKPKGRDSKDAITAEMKTNPDFFLGVFEQGKLAGMAIASCDCERDGSTAWQYIHISESGASQKP